MLTAQCLHTTISDGLFTIYKDACFSVVTFWSHTERSRNMKTHLQESKDMQPVTESLLMFK